MAYKRRRLGRRKGFSCQTPDPKDVAFFKEHAGGRVGHAAEGAFKLAKAECVADKLGYRFDWSNDDDPDLSFMNEKERKQVREVLCVDVKSPKGERLDSICGIIDPERSYVRVVEAEMALENLPDVALKSRAKKKSYLSGARRRRRR
jgi:hypothetical protein